MTVNAAPVAWAVPGTFPVAPGIHRVPLPLPLTGLPAVNVYVVDAPGGPVLIDSGWAGDASLAALQAGLHTLGVDLTDVAGFVVTHAHWDHYSQAVAVRRRHGTPISVGAGERPDIEGFDDTHGLYPHQLDRLVRAGAGGLAARVRAKAPDPHEVDVPHEGPDHWLADGDTVAVAGGALEVIATPGHTRGHVVLRHTPTGVVFTGDHVLPRITPAVGHEYDPPTSPLHDYLLSLARTREFDDALMAPAHGPVGGSVGIRSAELISHHETRLEEVATLVAAGHDTAFAVATAMRWTSRARTLDELDVVHAMTAVLEVDAHLEVLTERGVVDGAIDGEVRHVARSRRS